MLKKERQVLLVINDVEVCKKTAVSIQGKFGFEVEIAKDGKNALAMIEESPWQYDVVVIYEVVKEKLTDIDILKGIKTNNLEIEVILITDSIEKPIIEAWRLDAYNCFSFPPNYEGIAYAVKCATEKFQLRRERKIVEKLQKLVAFLDLVHLAKSKLEILDACIDEMLAIFDAHSAIIYDTRKSPNVDPNVLPTLDFVDIYMKNIDCKFDIPNELLLKIKKNGPQTINSNEFPREWDSIKVEYSQCLMFTLDFQEETLGLVMLFTKVDISFILHEIDRYNLASFEIKISSKLKHGNV